eukprot:2485336-Prymnesium_polylepis.2
MGSWIPRSMHSQQRDAIRFLSRRWPDRSERVAGHSNLTVPAYASMHPDFKCDILSVEGWHGSPETAIDVVRTVSIRRYPCARRGECPMYPSCSLLGRAKHAEALKAGRAAVCR